MNLYTMWRGIWNGSVECHIELAASNNGLSHGLFCFWILPFLKFYKTNGCFVRKCVAVIILEMINICFTEIKFLPQLSIYVYFHVHNHRVILKGQHKWQLNSVVLYEKYLKFSISDDNVSICWGSDNHSKITHGRQQLQQTNESEIHSNFRGIKCEALYIL